MKEEYLQIHFYLKKNYDFFGSHYSDRGFKDTVVNRALSSLIGESLESASSVPVKNVVIVLKKNINMYKGVISVCLFVCPIITQEPLNRFASNLYWGTWESHGNVLILGLRC